jgi:hypothetical protein
LYKQRPQSREKGEVTMVKKQFLGKPVFRRSLFILILLVFQCGTFGIGLGKPFRLSKIPDKGKNFGCATCHVDPRGGGERNAFGRDFNKYGVPNGNRYTEELGKLDSDGDGITNDEEFAARTHPGDPNARPDKPVQ